MEKSLRIGVFPGSFNPFTIGHYSIVERAVGLFDRLIVAVGYNAEKGLTDSIESRVESIKKYLCSFENVDVVAYSGLTIDFCHSVNAKYIVRGIRTVADFEYERNMADVNRQIGNVETVLLYSLPQHGAVSSSIVRELQQYGVNVSQFLPNDNIDKD